MLLEQIVVMEIKTVISKEYSYSGQEVWPCRRKAYMDATEVIETGMLVNIDFLFLGARMGYIWLRPPSLDILIFPKKSILELADHELYGLHTKITKD